MGGSGRACVRPEIFPSTVHPEPLLGMLKDQPLQRSIVSTRIRADRLVVIVTLDHRKCVLKAEYVLAVRLSPGCGRNHRGSGCERDRGEASKGLGFVPKKVDLHTVSPAGVLIENEHDDILGGESVEDGLECPFLGKDSETGAAKPPGDQGIEP